MLCYAIAWYDEWECMLWYGISMLCYAMAYIVKDMLKLTVLIVKAT